MNMGTLIGSFALGFMIFGMLLLIFIVLAFIFWIYMLIDCAKRKFKQENDKVVWILILVFLGFIGAIIYYFIIKRK